MKSYITFDRRGWLRAAAVGALSASGWLHNLAAAPGRRRGKSVILLWMNGGPSTIDLWDLKPGHENGGPFKESRTPVAGLRVSEHLPKLAALGDRVALVRSLTSKEGDHGRAGIYVRTGYVPQGGILFPVVGSLVARALVDPTSDLPGFVSIVPPHFATAPGGGFLGPRYRATGGRGRSDRAGRVNSTGPRTVRGRFRRESEGSTGIARQA